MNNNFKGLSIITPVYNGAKYIKRCYRNLCMQTYTDWEWIVVDDGSKDSTYKEIQELEDNRIRSFRYSNNKGRGYARTKAIKESRGKWIVIWDVDDFHFPQRLEEIAKIMDQGYDYFCSHAVVTTNNLEIKSIRGFERSQNGALSGILHPTLACEAKILNMIGYNPLIKTGEDATVLWLLAKHYKGYGYEDVLTIYMEDTEINLQKAIDCNLSHKQQVQEIYHKYNIYSKKDYYILMFIYMCKLVFLKFLKLKPDIYLYTIKYRSKLNEKKITEEQQKFILQLKELFKNVKAQGKNNVYR